MSGSSGRPRVGCREKALELLALRSHFRRELERKLANRRYPENEIAEVADGLESEGLLDDLAAAREIAGGAFRRKLFGPLRVAAELRRRGVESAVIDRVLRDAFAEGESELVSAAAERWLARHPPERTRLARHLQAKGFTAAAIRAVLPESSGREPLTG